MKELKFLEEQGVSSSLINKIVKFREVYPVSDEVKKQNYQTCNSILWKRYSGDGHRGDPAGTESASDRTKSNRQKYFGRKSGIYF